MANGINSGFTDNIVKAVRNIGKSGISDENASQVIQAISDDNEKGIFDKLFGSRTENLVIYVTLILCVILIGVGCCALFINIQFASEYWKLLFPVLTGAFGYMFGRKDKN